MIELIKDKKIVKCKETSPQFQKLIEAGYKVKEEVETKEVKEENEEVKKPVKRTRTRKTNKES